MLRTDSETSNRTSGIGNNTSLINKNLLDKCASVIETFIMQEEGCYELEGFAFTGVAAVRATYDLEVHYVNEATVSCKIRASSRI